MAGVDLAPIFVGERFFTDESAADNRVVEYQNAKRDFKQFLREFHRPPAERRRHPFIPDGGGRPLVTPEQSYPVEWISKWNVMFFQRVSCTGSWPPASSSCGLAATR